MADKDPWESDKPIPPKKTAVALPADKKDPWESSYPSELDPGGLEDATKLILKAPAYTAGLIRTGLGNAALGIGEATGMVDPQKGWEVTKQSALDALKGEAPSSEVYRNQFGPSIGLKASEIPGISKVPFLGGLLGKGGALENMDVLPTLASPRASTLLDLAIGPPGAQVESSIEGKTANEIRALTKAAEEKAQTSGLYDKVKSFVSGLGRGTTASDLTKSASKMVYGQGIPTGVPQEAEDLMFNKGMRGSALDLSNAVESEKSNLGKQIGSIEKQGNELVPPEMIAPIQKTSFEEAIKMADSQTPEYQREGRKRLKEIFNRAKNGDPASISEIAAFKREQGFLANKAGQFGNPARESLPGAYHKAANADAVKWLEETLDEAQPGLGGQYHDVNKQWGALDQATRPLARAAEKPVSIYPTFSDLGISAPVTAYSYSHHVSNPFMTGYLTSKIAKNPWVLTTAGQAGKALSDSRLPDALMREAQIQSNSPWSLK